MLFDIKEKRILITGSSGGLGFIFTHALSEAGAKVIINGTNPEKLKKAGETLSSWLCSRTLANRWGDPQELVGALIFLASQSSSFINGQIIYVDGGITACI